MIARGDLDGKIRQVKTSIASTLVTHNTTSMVELSSNYRVIITPLNTTNIIQVHVNMPFNASGMGANTIIILDVKRSTDGGSNWSYVTGSGYGDSNLGNRWPVAVGATRRSNGYDSNDMNICSFSIIDKPATTSTCTYSIFMKQETSNTGNVLIAHSSGNNSNWGWMTPVVMTAYELDDD
jgi:hypothetical protein